jgi:Xaa-Pro aminopeptidase
MMLMLACAVSASAPAAARQARPTDDPVEARAPALPPILTLRERAKLEDRWLKRRLETLVPALMREHGFDMWVLIAREYLEDPVLATMLDAENMHARRRTILIFFDPGGGKPVERLTVSRYGLGGLFEPAWEPEKQPDQWKRLGELIAERNPKRIAVNSSSATAFADGLTHSQYQGLLAALPKPLRGRVTATDDLAVEWLATRTAEEMAVYPDIVRTAHSIIAEALSDKVITPGKTTSEDVVWWMRERTQALGLKAWFQPSLGILRQGVKGMLEGNEVIRKGDMLWTDFGFTYLRLNTDTQHLGYVLKDGERDAPRGLKAGLAAANAVQDALTAQFKVGRTGNEVLALARRAALERGLKPTIYTHPIGHHGHGAGPNIGFWDNQGPSPSGERPLRANTAFSIELNAKVAVPEWGGQEVEFRSEEDAFFDGEKVRYLDGRQQEFHLVGKHRD